MDKIGPNLSPHALSYFKEKRYINIYYYYYCLIALVRELMTMKKCFLDTKRIFCKKQTTHHCVTRRKNNKKIYAPEYRVNIA